MLRWPLPLAAVTIVAAAAVWVLASTDQRERPTVARPSAKAPRPDVTRDCRTHIEGRLPPAERRRDLIVGPVRFRGFRETSRFAARERGRGFFEHRNGEYGALKFVTEVRAGADVVVAIAPVSRHGARLLYARDIKYGRFGIPFEEGERAVRFRACAADHPAFAPRFYRRRTVGPWTQFNGGFLLTGPQCLRLDVYERGRAARRFAEPFGRARAGCRV